MSIYFNRKSETIFVKKKKIDFPKRRDISVSLGDSPRGGMTGRKRKNETRVGLWTRPLLPDTPYLVGTLKIKNLKFKINMSLVVLDFDAL